MSRTVFLYYLQQSNQHLQHSPTTNNGFEGASLQRCLVQFAHLVILINGVVAVDPLPPIARFQILNVASRLIFGERHNNNNKNNHHSRPQTNNRKELLAGNFRYESATISINDNEGDPRDGSYRTMIQRPAA
jgi:hypothetical protein